MLVVMACTMAIAAPITMVVGVILALRQDVGLSIVLVIAMPVAAIVLGMHRGADGAGVPADAGAHRPGQPRAARADHRHPRRARVRARAAGGARGSPSANADLTAVSLRGGRLMSAMFPTVNLLINLVERRACSGSAPARELGRRSRSARSSRTSSTSCRS